MRTTPSTSWAVTVPNSCLTRSSGNAPRATVALRAVEDGIYLRVSDEGCGFDPERIQSPGIGLASMRERALHLDGTFSIRSRPGEGTRIEVVLPLGENAATA